MKVWSFTIRLIQMNTYLPYFPPDCPGQVVKSLPDNNIKKILFHAMPNTWGKIGRTGIQLVRWSYPFYSRKL